MPPSMNKTGAIEDPSDAVAEAQAAQARQQGTDMIRDHLRGHLDQNPTSSYVTWIATLHPENATVSIDPRFLTPGNPWKTVYEETKYGIYGGGSRPPDDEGIVVQGSVDAVTIPQQERSFGGFIDLMVFSIIAIVAVAMAFALEVMTVVFRGVANLFECLTDACSRHAVTKYTFGVIFWIVWKSFWFSEMIVLYTSVMVAELLAGINLVLCSMFSLNCKIGRAAHQRTRRLAHLTRWACRRPFAGATATSSSSSSDLPEYVEEISSLEQGKQASSSQEVPTATAIPEENNTETIQTATVVAIHDDCKSNQGAV